MSGGLVCNVYLLSIHFISLLVHLNMKELDVIGYRTTLERPAQ